MPISQEAEQDGVWPSAGVTCPIVYAYPLPLLAAALPQMNRHNAAGGVNHPLYSNSQPGFCGYCIHTKQLPGRVYNTAVLCYYQNTGVFLYIYIIL